MTDRDASATESETPAAIRVRWEMQAAAASAQLDTPGVAPRETLAVHAGLEFFAAISRGELPSAPIGALIDFVPVDFEPGRFVFQGTPAAKHYNPIGSVHGGYAATLLDSCLGCAIHTLLPAGRGYTTLELKVNYVRALTVDTGPVRAEGKVVHLGGQTAIAEGRLTDAAGKLYAFATTTCLIFTLPPAATRA